MERMPTVSEVLKALCQGKSRPLTENDRTAFAGASAESAICWENVDWIAIADWQDGVMRLDIYGSDMTAWTWSGPSFRWTEI